MELQTLTFIVVSMTFMVYIGIAIWARAGSTSEFYVAGGGVNPVANKAPAAVPAVRNHRSSPSGRWSRRNP